MLFELLGKRKVGESSLSKSQEADRPRPKRPKITNDADINSHRNTPATRKSVKGSSSMAQLLKATGSKSKTALDIASCEEPDNSDPIPQSLHDLLNSLEARKIQRHKQIQSEHTRDFKKLSDQIDITIQTHSELLQARRRGLIHRLISILQQRAKVEGEIVSSMARLRTVYSLRSKTLRVALARRHLDD